MEFSFMFMLLLIVLLTFQSNSLGTDLYFECTFSSHERPLGTDGLNIPTRRYSNGRRGLGVM